MKSFRIILDTSFLMLSTLDLCWHSCLLKLYKINNESFVIPKKVVDELNRLQQYDADPLKQNRARQALLWLNQAQKQGIVEIFGSELDPRYNDHLILNVFLKNCVDKNLILISQDEDLAKDVLLINEMKSFHKREIFVFKFNDNIESVSFHLNEKLNERLYKNQRQIEVNLDQTKFKINQKLYDFLKRNRLADLPIVGK